MDEKEHINLLAFDIGASSGRAILGKLKNKNLEIETIHRFPNEAIRVFESDYWNILELFKEIIIGLKKCTVEKAKFIDAIGIDTWGVDFVLLDDNYELIGMPHTYRDKRTEGVINDIYTKISQEEIFRETGIQFMDLNSLVQLAALKMQNSPQLTITSKILMIPDYLNFLLTGVLSTEYSIATTTQLFNPSKKDWADKLIKRLGFKRSWFQKVVLPGTILGKISDSIQEETGLRNEVKVIAPLCHDTGCAVAATPVEMERYKRGEWAYLSSGTWSLLGVELDDPIINEKALKHNFTNEGGIAGTIRFLKNITGLWIIQECKKIWDSNGFNMTWDQIIQEANRAEAFKVYLNVDDPLFLNPPYMIDALKQYWKKTHQTLINSIGEISRAIFENMAFKYKNILENLEDITGKKVKIIHIIGGGSKNDLLNQFTANATNLIVKAGPSEATAIGNILVQALALDMIENVPEMRKIVSNSFPIKEYSVEDATQWNEAYSDYLTVTNL